MAGAGLGSGGGRRGWEGVVRGGRWRCADGAADGPRGAKGRRESARRCRERVGAGRAGVLYVPDPNEHVPSLPEMRGDRGGHEGEGA